MAALWLEDKDLEKAERMNITGTVHWTESGFLLHIFLHLKHL